MEEIWKDIKGYEGLYQISNLGRVKSLPKIHGKRYQDEMILKLTTKEYYQITLSKKGKKIAIKYIDL